MGLRAGAERLGSNAVGKFLIGAVGLLTAAFSPVSVAHKMGQQNNTSPPAICPSGQNLRWHKTSHPAGFYLQSEGDVETDCSIESNGLTHAHSWWTVTWDSGASATCSLYEGADYPGGTFIDSHFYGAECYARTGCAEGEQLPHCPSAAEPRKKKQFGQQCVALESNPIHSATGNKYQQETDYAAATGGLHFKRSYNSGSGQSGVLGVSWRHHWQAKLKRYDDSSFGNYVVVTRPDGQAFYFKKNNGNWENETDITARLTEIAGGYVLTVGPTQRETYDVDGRLIEIELDGSRKFTLVYSGSLLSSISDRFGRALYLAYDGQGRLATLTDPDNKVISYGYDTAGNLISTTYPGNQTRFYHYEDASFPNALTGITDENGRRYAKWTYDAQGRAVSSEHAGGADRGTLTYNADGTTTITDSLGLTRTRSYTLLQGVYKSSTATAPSESCGDNAASTTYDANGFVASKADFNGNTTTYLHNTRGLEESRTEAYGTPLARTITTQWHATYRVPTQIDEPGRRTSYTYDAGGNRLTETVTDTATSEARTTTWTYNTLGQVLTVDGPRTDVSDITTYTYDPQGNVATITNALNQTTQITHYDAHGNPTRIVDPNGVETLLTYDLRQRLKTRSIAGATTSFDYDAVGQLIKVTLPGGAFLAYTYDAAHRLTDIQDNLGNRIHYTLDLLGNRTKEEVFDPSNNLKRAQSQVFNALGRLVQIKNAAHQVVTEFGYDPQGNRVSQKDFETPTTSHTTAFLPDALNRTKQVTDAANGVTQYGHNALDQLISVTDPKTLTTSYTINALGDVKQQASPDTGTTGYTYDDAGNRKTQTDARGITVTYSYDALDRLTLVDHAGTEEDVSYFYDGTNYTGTVPNGVGRLTGIQDQSGTTEYRYDARGNLAQEIKTIAGQTYVTGYSYDSADRLIAMTYPSGRVVSYPRDTVGRIASVTTTQGAATTTLASALSHLPHGPVSSLTLGNGLAWQAQFDQNYRITRLTAGTVQDLSYAYDLRDNITAITDAVHPTRSQTFGPDALSRLVAAQGAYGTMSYTYDGVGNRTTETHNSATDSYSYPATSHRLQSVSGTGVTAFTGATTFTYDAAGNATQKGNSHYQYNLAGRLDRIERMDPLGPTRIADARYNAQGQRATKTLYRPAAIGQSGEAVTVVFHYDAAGHLIAETCADGRLVAEYAYLDDVPLALWRRPKDALTQAGADAVLHECQLAAAVLPPLSLYYFHTDHLGTPQQLTDAAQQIVWDAVYEPFGEVTLVTEEVTQPLRFPGQYFDAETGLHQNWHRDYDPSLGRFLQPDPIGLDDGPSVYGYAWQNPINFFDPDGLEMVCVDRYRYHTTRGSRLVPARYERLTRCGFWPKAKPKLPPPRRPRWGRIPAPWGVSYKWECRQVYEMIEPQRWQATIETWQVYWSECTDTCTGKVTIVPSGRDKLVNTRDAP